ncbi:G protein-coupled glucose receptor regulating Gpa2-domain-containing protein [Xylogone sp. PMI_703]|nr:G protein-coupled glucose receptor regulating Gpa2-domain-containing protein [Xylogone sp. PMI_703]
MDTLKPESQTLTPLPDVLSHGLVAVSTFGLLSFFCSTSLFLYLSYRLFTWHLQPAPASISASQPSKRPPMNQFLFLIYNLLFADMQQAMAFLLNIYALRRNGIFVETTTCWAQGWFVSTGDLASSTFICAIAIHTFFAVVKGYRLPSKIFYPLVVLLWTFVYVMALIGPIIHGRKFFARASAWCWINSEYEDERLWLHYFWIFLFMFSTILIYGCVAIYLRFWPSKSPTAVTSTSLRNSTHSATPLMIIYPLIYVVCTIPLAAGRIASLAGKDISLGYFCVAGSMIACNGWLDVLLYASTRAEIVFSESRPDEDAGIDTFGFLGWTKFGPGMGNVTRIEASTSQGHGGKNSKHSRGGKASMERSESSENLYGIGLRQIGVKGEVSISVEERAVPESERSQSRYRHHPSSGGSGKASWEGGRSGESMMSTDA